MENQNEKTPKVFETSDLDLGAYLLLHGLAYIGSRIEVDSGHRKPKAILQFEDLKQNARDLERTFVTSEEKRFRDLNKYLLREAHKAIQDRE